MKKVLLAAAIAGSALTVGAQNVIERPTFGDNWSIGLDAGVTTPLKGHSFFQNMRGNYGIHVAKQLTPVVGVGVEGAWGVNTTSSRTAFDTQYVGAYGTANLFNLFGGFSCTPRKFWIDAKAGIGWGHDYYPGANDDNYIAAKTGLDFNFAVCDNFSIAVKPGVTWNLAGTGEPAQFDSRRANFDVMVGFNYNFGPGFQCVACPDYSADIAALNDQVNALRAGVVAAADDLAASQAQLAISQAQNAELAAALAEAQSKAPVVVADTTFNSVRFVFFKIGKSTITPDQMPNVEMIADYMKHNPSSTVVIKGYASQDGPEEVNIRLAQARAQSVKDALIKKYGIKADRIKAEGQGIGHMFKEESWNRVSICTLDEN
ncbi:MAG: OmpA family protein [Duncaniella sp.]|nr:OmpA family protein [Bacteroides sp.]MDE6066168.1 OmpA family protein [Duncaniella sp.]